MRRNFKKKNCILDFIKKIKEKIIQEVITEHFLRLFYIKYKDFFILIIFMIIEGIVSIRLGADVSWDTQNYHLYNPFAFLTNRYNLDIMAAGIQTFYSPFPDIPFYLLIKYFNNYPLFVAFIQGSLGGILIFFVYKIATLLFENFRSNWIYILCSIILAASGTMFNFELGSGMTTIQSSIFVLASLYILLKNLFSIKQNYRLTLLSGVLSGIALAEKWTSIIFILSILISICILYKNIKNPFKNLFIYSITTILVFMSLTIYWSAFVFKYTGNPIFPYYNNIFKSDMTEFITYIDQRFLNVPILQKIFFPFIPLKGDRAINFEGKIIDFRYLAAFLSLFFIVIVYYAESLRNIVKSIITKEIYNRHTFLFIFMIFSYFFWCLMYFILRYMIPFEVLSGLSMCLFIHIISKVLNKEILGKIFCCIAASLILFNTLYAIDFWRRPLEHNEKYIYFEDLKLQDNDIVILLATFPLGSLVLFQNPKTRFINFTDTPEYDFIYSDKYKLNIKKLISENKDNVKVIYNEYFKEADFTKIEEFVDINDFKCRSIDNNMMFCDYYYCEIDK